MGSKPRLLTLALLAAALCGCQVLQEARQSLRRDTATPAVTAVEGQVRNAITQAPVAGARLQTGLTTALADVQGSFSISVLTNDPLQISAPGFESTEVLPTAGQALVVDLAPDASTTFAIIYDYELRQEFRREYDLLHPDVQAVVGRDDFVRYMEQHRPFDLIDFSMGAGRLLTSSTVLGKVYQNVAEVPMQATVREEGRVVQQSWLEHAAKVDGLWRWLRGPLAWPEPTPGATSSVPATMAATADVTHLQDTPTAQPTATPALLSTIPAVPTPYVPLLPGTEAKVVVDQMPVHTGPGTWYAVALLLSRSMKVQILDWPRWVDNEPWYPVLVPDLTVSSWCGGTYLEQVAHGSTQAPTETVAPWLTPTPTRSWPLPPIAFTSERDGNREVYLMNADGSGQRNLTQNVAQDGSPSWAPTRDRLAFVSDRHGNSDIFVIGADGSALRQLTSGAANEIHPAWSPDGALIAYVSDADGDWEISLVSATGAGAVQVTDNSDWDSWPAWSPDGRRLVYTSQRDGNFELYLYELEGGAEVRLTDDPASDAFPSWSPSGQEIAFTSARDGQLEIYVLTVNDAAHAVVRLTHTARADVANRYPTWSTDGNWLAFTSWRDGNAEIYLMHRQGWGLTNLTNDPAVDEAPAWAN